MSLLDEILTEALPDPLKAFFGDEVTYTPLTGSPYLLTVIMADPNPTEPTFPGNLTIADAAIADMAAAPVKGDKVTIGAVEYTVFDFKRDSVGPSGLFVRLGLQKRS